MEGNKNFARKYDLSLGPILCGQTHFARVQMAMSTNGSRLLQFAADEIESDEFVEDLQRYLALPRMVPEIRLPRDNTFCNGIRGYSSGEMSGARFLFFRMETLPLMRFISLWLSCSLSTTKCGMESHAFGES